MVSKHINQQLSDGEWLDAIIWDRPKPNPAYLKISLDLNDPNMLFDMEKVETEKARVVEAKQVKKGRKPLPKPLPKIPMIVSTDEPQNKLPISRFNLSNDKFYESHYTGRLVRVRQTLGELVVQHALPALKLHPVLVSQLFDCTCMRKRLTVIVYSTRSGYLNQSCVHSIDHYSQCLSIQTSLSLASRCAKRRRRIRKEDMWMLCEPPRTYL